MNKILLILVLLSGLFIPAISYTTSAAKPAKRIIALSPHGVEMLYAIGADDRIIATIDTADYPVEALKIPRIGNFTGSEMGSFFRPS